MVEEPEKYCTCKRPDPQFDRTVSYYEDGEEKWGGYYCGKCGKEMEDEGGEK